ncbi:T9SS type A sorting domain-containing protein [Flavobacterium gelidilacus]
MNIMKKTTLILCALLSFGLAFAQPTTNAPVPTKAAADVKSVFSDTYTTIATNYNPNWGQSGFASVNPTFDPTGGGTNFVLAYPNFNYQGTELTSQSLSNMEFLHVDVWTSANPANSILQVSPINNGTGAGETLVTINHTAGSWYSVDIPKSAFTGMTWDSVFQMKFAANGAGSTVPITIYLDNIYFWKTPVAAGSDANLSDLKVDGATIAGFSPNTIAYTKGLPAGTTVVPQITSVTTNDTNATQVTTQATAIPGSATVVVTSQNTTVTKTYTVNYVIEGPATAAPTPPNRPVADVKSIFSNAYAPIAVLNYAGVDGQPSNDNTFNTSWCGANTSLVSILGNDTNKITGLGCEGVAFLSGRFDASSFTYFHMDIWTATPTLDKSFNIKFSNWNGGAGEANAIEFSTTNANFLTNPNPGTWISLDIPLTNFTPVVNANRNDLVQFVITSDLGTVYYDNLYLHKNTVLSNSNFELSLFNVYPNPTQNVWNITSKQNITSVVLFDVMGKKVQEVLPNNTTIELNAAELANGIYFANVTSELGTKVIKLIKN